MPRRTRAGKVEIYVKRHSWRNGAATSHPGYWRPLRPVGRKRILGKKYNMRVVHDQYGQFKGWKRV